MTEGTFHQPPCNQNALLTNGPTANTATPPAVQSPLVPYCWQGPWNQVPGTQGPSTGAMATWTLYTTIGSNHIRSVSVISLKKMYLHGQNKRWVRAYEEVVRTFILCFKYLDFLFNQLVNQRKNFRGKQFLTHIVIIVKSSCDRFFCTDLHVNIADPTVCTHGSFQLYIANLMTGCTKG